MPTTAVFLPLLVVLGSTAAIVSASNSRQENLSGRTRLLAQEFRTLAIKNPTNKMERERLCKILHQVLMFKDRVTLCVRGHIALYLALILELVGFGLGLIALFSRPYLDQDSPILAQGAILVASALLFSGFLSVVVGMVYHIREYWRSPKTMGIELDDLSRYDDLYCTKDKETKTFDVEAFLNSLHHEL